MIVASLYLRRVQAISLRERGLLTLAEERLRAEESVRESRELLLAILDNNDALVAVKNLQGRYLLINRQFEQRFHLSRDLVVGRSGDDLLTPEMARFFRTDENEIRGCESRLECEVTVQHNGVKRVYHSLKFPLCNFSGQFHAFCFVLTDITERRTLENQLRQSQKIEAVGRLAGGVAHDFNNLLGVIIGYSELLLDSMNSTEPAWHKVEEIRQAGLRAAGLTRQLLAFSRQQVLEPKILDLNASVQDIGKLLRRLIGEDIELSTVFARQLGKVKADPGQVEQILMNLAVNSRDAMPRGGKLTVETANVEIDEPYAQLHAGMVPGSYVMLAVSDTGCGMDADTQSHIFEPFFTTKEKGKGTGLGLATVYGIVKQSGGYILVYSEPGHGMTVKVFFPRVADGSPALAAQKEPPSVPAVGSETVLLVEDEPSLRNLAFEVLRQGGFRVLGPCEGAEAAQRLCKDFSGPIHLLLTDVVMPGASGRELAQNLTPSRPEMQVLYMSGYTDDSVVNHGVLQSRVAFLQKPFGPNELLDKVRQVLDNRAAS